MKIINIDGSNVEHEHICCAIGADKQNACRAASKKEWLKERFKDGLVFKRFDERGKLFIEYMPVEKVWKPITGRNFFVINCLWVSGQFKGTGLAKQLLEECIRDAKTQKKSGIAVVTSTKTKPFLTDKAFFVKHGFQSIETAPPYFELLVLKLEDNAELPEFTENVKKGICGNKNGFTFIYSNQCPFMEEYVSFLKGILLSKKIPAEVIKLGSCEEAQMYGSPFGTLGIYYNGELKTHELMTEKNFEKFLSNIIAV